MAFCCLNAVPILYWAYNNTQFLWSMLITAVNRKILEGVYWNEAPKSARIRRPSPSSWLWQMGSIVRSPSGHKHL